MSQYVFGAGVLWGTPLTDSSGAAIAVPTPVQFGALQDVSVDISFDMKLLHGPNQFPLIAARGKGKISGKAKSAELNGALLNSMIFGQTKAFGVISDVWATSGVAIPTTPFQITVVPPSSGTWSRDLGVENASGVPMTRVSAAPATGQYSVAAGVYTFAAADVGLLVFINYQYTATGATSPKSTVANVAMGAAPTFMADLYMPFSGKTLILTLNACVATKFSLGTKLDDFMIPETDFEAYADASGNVGTWALTE